MSETITVTPKSAAALASPKIMKPTQKSFAGFSSVPSVAYGCEHIQGLFKENHKISVQQYNLLLQTMFEKSASLSHVLRSNEPYVGPTYLCLQCPSIHSAEQRDRHYQLKRHAFAMDSKSGHLYCQECSDFIYDPSLEEYRLQRGRRKRKLAAYLSTPEDARLVSANSQPVPCRANGLRGLYNMGQTCFMSVIMQSLIHNPFIRSYYLSEGHKSGECEKEKESCTSCALDDIFQEFYSLEKTEGYGAVNMLMGSWMANSSLAGYQQQDAHEYMQFLLHSLHQENSDQSDESNGYGGGNEADCDCVIHRTFYGKLQSNVTCDKCRNTTTRIDPVMDLSLDIKSQVKRRKLEKARAEAGSDGETQAPKDIEIQDCLDRFTGREKLGVQDYVCQKCGGEQSAIKQLSVKQLPPCLPIHLKRFEHSGKDSGKKLAAKIKFPLQLDMFPYTSRAKAQAKASKRQTPKLNTSEREAAVFSLNTVVVHKGSIDSGHYVSYSRDGDEWFLFDDSKVVLANEAEVLGAEAYLLFYVAATPPD